MFNRISGWFTSRHAKKQQRDNPTAPGGCRRGILERVLQALLHLWCVGSAVMVLRPWDSPPLARALEALLVLVPWAIVTVVTARHRLLLDNLDEDYDLWTGPRTTTDGGTVDGAHEAWDDERWRVVETAARNTWEYERVRALRARCQDRPIAALYSAITVSMLSVGVIVLESPGYSPFGPTELGNKGPRGWMFALMAAATVAFARSLTRIALRLSGGTVSSRSFAWATRSVVLGLVGATMLYFSLPGFDPAPGVVGGLLLGALSGLTGDQAIRLAEDKIAVLFNLKLPSRPQTDELVSIEGLTSEHVERLNEENILTLHDLAFAPTARLFFNTSYSLQQICNWQDRALLHVYVGKKNADSLARQMQILGAIDLQGCAHACRRAADANRSQREALGRALSLDEGGLLNLLESMEHDEVTQRLRVYWRSAPAPRGFSRDAGSADATLRVSVSEVLEITGPHARTDSAHRSRDTSHRQQ